jgi:IclR family KDG regulon transcriptional repressor
MSREQVNIGWVSLSVWHAMQVLGLFAAKPELGITDMSRALSISKSGAQRLVNALVCFEFLERDPDTRKYKIGVGALQVGSLFLQNCSAENEARPFMREIVCELGHTCQYGVIHDNGIIITVSIEGPGPIKYSVPIGHRLPLHTSAVGKAVLSTRNDNEVEAILTSAGMPARTEKSLKTPLDIIKLLCQVRARGYAINWEENQPGIGSIAAPITRRHSGAAIGIAFPIASVRKSDQRAYDEKVADCARKIAMRLSGGTSSTAA